MSSLANLESIEITSQTSFVDDIYEKIKSFSSIPENYFYGNSPVIEHHVIEQALRMHNECFNFNLKCNAFPGINGDIMFKVYRGKTILEFTINPNSSIELIESKNGEDVNFVENLTIKDALKRIKGLLNKTSCGLSESYQESFGTKKRVVLRRKFSNRVVQKGVAASLSSLLPASREGSGLYANTYRPTITHNM